MRKGLRFSWIQLIFIVLFILIYFVSKFFIDARYTDNFNFAPRIFWMYIWTLFLGAYFARDHVRSWFTPGKISVDYAYLIIAVICLILNFRPIPGYGYIVGNFAPILWTIFWNSIISAFYKDNSYEK